METRAGNAFVNLYLDLGHAQDHHGHRNGDTSRERRRQKRAAERQAAAQSVEEAELARATENASTLRSTENVAKKDSGESGENPEGNTCALCERTFENVKGLKIHEGKQHRTKSPIPQLDGCCDNIVEYEFTLDAHEVCTDDDAVEALKTNFHCPLDDKLIDKTDPIRLFDVKKTSESLEENRILRKFRVFVKDDDDILKMIEDWKIFGKFDDRAFMNSTHYDINIRIKELKRLG